MTGLSRQQRAIYDTLVEARGGWVSSLVLNRIAFRYGARIYDLRLRGVTVDKKPGAHGEYLYRVPHRVPVGMQLGLKLDLHLTEEATQPCR